MDTTCRQAKQENMCANRNNAVFKKKIKLYLLFTYILLRFKMLL